MCDDDGWRRENEIAHDMVGMWLGMNNEPHGLGCKFLDRRSNHMAVLRTLPGVDQHDAFLC